MFNHVGSIMGVVTRPILHESDSEIKHMSGKFYREDFVMEYFCDHVYSPADK